MCRYFLCLNSILKHNFHSEKFIYVRDVLLLPAKFRFTLISHNRKVQGFFLLNSISHKFIPNFHFYFLIKQKGFFVVPGGQSNDIEFLLLCIKPFYGNREKSIEGTPTIQSIDCITFTAIICLPFHENL